MYASYDKILDPSAFAKIVYHYQLVGPNQHIGPVLANLLAATLPWVEAITGLLLICGVWRREAAAVAAAMLVAFLAAVGWALYQGIDVANCGCFSVHGEGRGLGWALLGSDALMLAAAVVLVASPPRPAEAALFPLQLRVQLLSVLCGIALVVGGFLMWDCCLNTATGLALCRSSNLDHYLLGWTPRWMELYSASALLGPPYLLAAALSRRRGWRFVGATLALAGVAWAALAWMKMGPSCGEPGNRLTGEGVFVTMVAAVVGAVAVLLVRPHVPTRGVKARHAMQE